MDLEWTDPPRIVKDEARDALTQLRAHPGKWALIAPNVSDKTRQKWWRELVGKEGIDFRMARRPTPDPLCALLQVYRYDIYARAADTEA